MALRQGDSGTAVFTLQRQLNRITKDYPFLGKLTVDGVFGSRMAATVRAFQKQFNLTADGVVGRQTWYRTGSHHPGSLMLFTPTYCLRQCI